MNFAIHSFYFLKMNHKEFLEDKMTFIEKTCDEASRSNGSEFEYDKIIVVKFIEHVGSANLKNM